MTLKLKLGLGLSNIGSRSVSPPTDIDWAGVHTVAENAVLGAVVGGALSGSDPGGLPLTFSIPDVSEKFNIDGTNIVVAGILDFETEPSHSVTIRATNSLGGTYDESFIITVTDVSEDPPDEPPPDGETDPDDPGNFDLPPYHVDVDGAVTIGGKKRANGSSAKLIHDIQGELPIEAGVIYTMRYDPDFTQMSQGGTLAMVGFVLKAGNDFRMYGLRGDGSTGLDAYDVEGENKWNQTSGFIESNEGDAQNGTQAGPNWFQMEVSADGTQVTIRTSGDGGATFDDEFTADVGPFDDITEITAWGPGIFFHGSDDGPFSLSIDVWRTVEVAAFTFVSSFESTTDANSYTATAQNIGPNDTSQPVVVAAMFGGNGTAAASTMTIGGIEAVRFAWELQGTGAVEWWVAEGVSGSSANIVHNITTTQTNYALAVFRMTRKFQVLDVDGALIGLTANGSNSTLDTELGGALLAAGIHRDVDTQALTMRGLDTEVSANNIENTTYFAVGSLTPNASTESVGMDLNGGTSAETNSPYCAVSFAREARTDLYPLEGITTPTFAGSFSRDLLIGAEFTGRYTDVAGAVSSLHNQKVSAQNLTDGGTSTRRPALTTAGPNSRACADFDGSTDWLSTGIPGILVGTKFVIVSFIADSIGATQGVLAGSTAGTWNIYTHDSSGDKIFGSNADGVQDFTSAAAVEGTVYVASLLHTGGNITLNVNGVDGTPVASGNSTSAGNLTLGAQQAGAFFFNGKIFEIATWDTLPTAPQRAAIIADFMAWVGAT